MKIVQTFKQSKDLNVNIQTLVDIDDSRLHRKQNRRSEKKKEKKNKKTLYKLNKPS